MLGSVYKSYDELPLFLNAQMVADVLGVAISSAYRGQCKLYSKVTPSIKHDLDSFQDEKKRLDDAIEAILKDAPCLKFFGLKNSDVAGWNLYQRLIIEAALQHYGAKTYSVDFVDNHWTALWFGLYKWNKSNNEYVLRVNLGKGEDDADISFSENMKPRVLPEKPQKENIILSERVLKELDMHASRAPISKEELIRRNVQAKFKREVRDWEESVAKAEAYNRELDNMQKADHLFLFLYVAETNTSNIHGVYFGEHCYTVDLRKSLPSTFLRPSSQHGWIVKGRESEYDFNKNIVCVIRVSVDLATEMLGSGTLLSQENFFPKETIDQGYNILLERQKGSRLSTKYKKILPEGLIADFG